MLLLKFCISGQFPEFLNGGSFKQFLFLFFPSLLFLFRGKNLPTFPQSFQKLYVQDWSHDVYPDRR